MAEKRKKQVPKIRKRSDRPDPEHDRYHKMGKNTGYSDRGDTIVIAPRHVEAMDLLLNQKTALYDMISSIQRTAQEQLVAIARREWEWWQMVAGDIGVDLNEGWSYRHGTACLVKTGNPAESKPPAPPEAKP